MSLGLGVVGDVLMRGEEDLSASNELHAPAFEGAWAQWTHF